MVRQKLAVASLAVSLAVTRLYRVRVHRVPEPAEFADVPPGRSLHAVAMAEPS
jgi:hypothetical protein